MKAPGSFALALVLGFTCTIVAPRAFSQAAAQPEVLLVELSSPVYPPLARQARISGDVKIQLRIRADGSVESSEVISGNPMLAPAALESAKKSTFRCHSCSAEATTYTLTYTFGFREDGDCGWHHVRAFKCLYLWRCGPAYDSASGRPPVIGQSPDRVLILADTRCFEPERAETIQ
jgi:TonB family protein